MTDKHPGTKHHRKAAEHPTKAAEHHPKTAAAHEAGLHEEVVQHPAKQELSKANNKMRSKQNVVERIQQFNQGRNPDLLQLKYQNMSADAFTFYRGSCHLFYEDLSPNSPLNEAPPVWSCGDLHLENFGSYKGDNRLVYFDINDFDEALLAPCTWDLTRLVTSLMVGAKAMGVTKSESLALCHCLLDTYKLTLAKGHSRTVERETAQGIVKDLLVSLQGRDRRTFLDSRTRLVKGSSARHLRLDGKKTLPLTAEEKAKISQFMQSWAVHQSNSSFYKLLDLAHRIAGTGSLGVERYVLLVEGNGSPHQNYLLDLKAESASSVQPYVKLAQPQWSNEAERVVAVQQRMQGTPPALLQAVEIEGRAFVLKELQPTQDRVSLLAWNGRLRRLEKLIKTLGQLLAWAQLRSGGRQGSAIADDLIHFAVQKQDEWPNQVFNYAYQYAAQVEEDYQLFREAFNTGKLKTNQTENSRSYSTNRRAEKLVKA